MVLGDSKRKWLHSADVLIRSKVTYQVKFIGKAEVDQPKGIEVARSALQKLSFNKQLKRSEGTKPAKVQLNINVKGITISETRSKEVLHTVPLHLISFCSDDKKDKHLFSFIAKIGDVQHYCFGFESASEANSITLTIGQAFDVAYQEFLKNNREGAVASASKNNKQMMEMRKRLNELALENSKLKERVAQLEGEQQNKNTNQQHNTMPMAAAAPTAVVDPFDMAPFVVPSSAAPSTFITSPPSLVRLPSPRGAHPNSTRTSASSAAHTRNHQQGTGAVESSSISFENAVPMLPPSSLPPALLAFDPLHN